MMDSRALAALADGIIPPDARDAGAGSVRAGPRLAERIEAGVNAALYLKGLEAAAEIAKERFGRDVASLAPQELHELLAALRDRMPALFKQLRMDVSTMYLGDPAVWARI